MNVYGFCTPVNGSLDLVDFLVKNIEGICWDLVPACAPQIFITESMPGKKEGTLMSVSYHTEGLGVITDDGESVNLSNVFVFVTDDIRRSFLKMNDSREILTALWQTIFHEVRHFVQFQLPIVDENLLTEAIIEQMVAVNKRFGEVSRNRLSSYSHCESEVRKMEADAIVVEALSTANFVYSWGTRGDGEFDYDKIRKIILMTKDQYDEEQVVLRHFTK